MDRKCRGLFQGTSGYQQGRNENKDIVEINDSS
jgi:hypothetical protein